MLQTFQEWNFFLLKYKIKIQLLVILVYNQFKIVNNNSENQWRIVNLHNKINTYQ